MKKHLHVLAFLIIAILILTEPLSVLASSTAGSGANDRYETDAETGTEAQDDTSNGKGENGFSFLNFERLFRELKDFIPSAISLVDAHINRHIRRCMEMEESLYEVIFQNDDESFTEYFFDYPVKYTDTSGLTPVVRDISLKLAKAGQSFKSATHSIATTFPKYLSDGITLNADRLSIAMFPDISREKKGKISSDGTKVSYTLDPSTSLEYSLTYLGFKENIMVSEYTGCTEYRFILETNGLEPKRIDGSWFLVDSLGEICATVGDILVLTADERNNTLGNLEFIEEQHAKRYEAVITLDPEYLSDPATVYPICIDPTIEVVYKSSSDAVKLADVTINSKTTSVGSKDALYIGRSNTNGIQRVLIKFPNLNLSKIPSGASINSARVELRDLMCQYWTMNVNCHIFNGNSWSESSASWSNVSPNSYISKPLSTCNVNYPDGTKLSTQHRYSFDITEAVIGWKEGVYDINKGLIFKADDTFEKASGEAYKTFGSYNRASYKPSLIINYNDTGVERPSGQYFLISKGAEKYLGLSNGVATPRQGLLKDLGNNVVWKITNCKSYYLIQPANDQTKYLVHQKNNNPKLVTLSKVAASTDNSAHWAINTNGNDRQAMVKNLSTNSYLYMADGGSLLATTIAGTPGTAQYINNTWYVSPTTYYGNKTSNPLQEFESSDAVFSSMTVDRGKSYSISATIGSKVLFNTANDFTYSCSDGKITMSGAVFTSKESGTTSVTATHRLTGQKQSFTVKVLKKAIIIVPGIFGSNLKYPNGDDAFSETIVNQIINSSDAKLAKQLFDMMKSPKKGDVFPANDRFGFGQYYKKLVENVESNYSNEYDVVFFAYDWRLSCAETAKELNTLIQIYDKSLLLCHSMGGLVASSMLSQSKNANEKIDKAIFIATPFLGASITPYLLAGGNFNEFYPINDKLVEFFIRINTYANDLVTMKSIFELFPTEQSENIKSSQFMGKDNYDKMVAAFPMPVSDSEAQSIYNALYDAKSFHRSLWKNGRHISNTINSYYIYGTNIDTIVGSNKRGVSSIDAIKGVNGDGIVPEWSASLNFKYANVKGFKSESNPNEFSHVDILESDEVLEYIRNIIGGVY